MGEVDKLVRAGIEAAMKPFADLLEKIAGPAAEELGLTIQDHVKVLRLRRQLRLFERVKTMLEEAGIEPKKVPLKLLGPIVEAASIEEDDTLQDKWAALLANAATEREDAIHPSFIEVLKQISATEAQFLDSLFLLRDDKGPRGKGKVFDEQIIIGMFPALRDELSTKVQREKVSQIRGGFLKAGLHLNLRRLELADHDLKTQNGYWYEMTEFGAMFVEACQSPKQADAAHSR